ncbi:MAG: serine protease, partial [Actinomycetota bacterium]|nr:serine protease [Actinomycetota bacterium]
DGLLRRLLPTGILGLATLVFFMGLAAAFTGAVLYAYYEARLDRQEGQLNAFIATYESVFDEARAELQAEGEAARASIDEQLNELAQFAAGGETLTSLAGGAEPSVWFVETLDETGGPSVGSAFVVFSDPDESFLLTSYTTIRAATAQPAPAITLVKRDQRLEASLLTWDEAADLALVSIPIGGLAPLSFIEDPAAVQVGDRIFAVSGLGATGVSIAQGVVADAAGNAITHDVGIGAALQGGPLVDSDGRVGAVASRHFNPSGAFDPLASFFAPPVRRACELVLQCPDGNAPSSG